MIEKIEEVVNRLVAELQEKPIATTVKGLIILWVLKQVIVWWKK